MLLFFCLWCFFLSPLFFFLFFIVVYPVPYHCATFLKTSYRTFVVTVYSTHIPRCCTRGVCFYIFFVFFYREGCKHINFIPRFVFSLFFFFLDEDMMILKSNSLSWKCFCFIVVVFFCESTFPTRWSSRTPYSNCCDFFGENLCVICCNRLWVRKAHWVRECECVSDRVRAVWPAARLCGPGGLNQSSISRKKNHLCFSFEGIICQIIYLEIIYCE